MTQLVDRHGNDLIIEREQETIPFKTYAKNAVISLDQIFELNSYYNQNQTISQPAKNSYLVFKCIQVIADRIPKVPIKYYDIRTGDEVYADENEAVKFMKNPNDDETFFGFLSRSLMFYALYGESFWVWVDSVGSEIGTGMPDRIDVVDPLAIMEDLDEYYNLKGWNYAGVYKTNEIKQYIPKKRMIQTRNANPYNMWRGLRAIDAIANEIGVDVKSTKELIRFYDNFAIPGTIVTAPVDSPITPEDMETYVRKIDSRHEGVNKRYKTMGLSGGLDVKTLGITQDKQQLQEMKRWVRDTVLAVLNVPLSYAGYTDGVNRAHAEEQSRNFWEYAASLLLRFQATINNKILLRLDPSIEAKFDLSTIDALKTDMGVEVDTGRKLWEMGWSANDLNEHYHWNLPEVDNVTDKNYKPFNLEEVGEEGEEPAPKEENGVKTSKIENKMRGSSVRRKFLNIQSGQERKVKKSMENYFRLQRSKILKELNKLVNAGTDSFTKDAVSKAAFYVFIEKLQNMFVKEDERLRNKLNPLYAETTEKGQEYALRLLSIDRDVILNQKIINERLNLITGINDSTFLRIKKQVFKGVNAGDTVDDIAASIKSVYNFTTPRSKVIARTETTNIINAATNAEYIANGVSGKEWITAGDDKVRENCRQAAEQGVIPVDDPFHHGLQYPGEPNCRCAISPVIGE